MRAMATEDAADPAREVRLRIGEGDLLDAQRLITRARLREPRRRALIAVAWLVVSVVLVQIFRRELPQALPLALAIGGVIAAALLAATSLLTVRLLIPRLVRRHLRAVPSFQDDLVYDWSPEGMRCRTVAGESQIRWAGYLRFLEDERIMLIWAGPVSYQLLPKRVFAPAQIDEIRGFLAASRPGT